MGWIKDSKGKCKIYDWSKTGNKYVAVYDNYTWQSKSRWDKYESCITYKNDTHTALKINKVVVQTCSCNSGTSDYWSSTGLVSPCKGYGADYYCRIRVTPETNTDAITQEGVEFDETKHTPTVHVANAGYNMNSKGSSTTKTAIFGNAPYAGNQGLNKREFTITDCPAIPPGGHAVVHIGVDNDSWDSGATTSNSTIRFLLDTSFSEITIEPVENGYVWVYNKSEGRWKLAKPIYIYKQGKWVSEEDYWK